MRSAAIALLLLLLRARARERRVVGECYFLTRQLAAPSFAGDISVLLDEYKWLSAALQRLAPQFGHTPQGVTQLYQYDDSSP